MICKICGEHGEAYICAKCIEHKVRTEMRIELRKYIDLELTGANKNCRDSQRDINKQYYRGYQNSLLELKQKFRI